MCVYDKPFCLKFYRKEVMATELTLMVPVAVPFYEKILFMMQFSGDKEVVPWREDRMETVPMPAQAAPNAWCCRLVVQPVGWLVVPCAFYLGTKCRLWWECLQINFLQL
jgi:hypothetical protein